MHSDLDSLETELFKQAGHLIIRDYQLIPYKIKLNRPWQSSSTHLNYRQGLLVRLIINDSLSAIGECAPMIETGTESLEQAQLFLNRKLASLPGKAVDAELISNMDDFPACRFSLETALLSLLGQIKRKNIAQLLKPGYCKSIKTNIMLGTLDTHGKEKDKNLFDRVKKAELDGFSCLKIKMGLDDIKSEIEILSHLLKQLSPTTQIRLDSNKSWTYEQTRHLLDHLEQNSATHIQHIDSIEEPLSEFNAKQYQSLQSNTRISIALDESFPLIKLSSVNDWKNYPARRLILKPMAQGGIIKSWQLARLAQQYKIEAVITSSIETGYGLWPITYLCAALNSPCLKQEHEQAHGIATASWLEDTLIEPPEIRHGTITL